MSDTASKSVYCAHFTCRLGECRANPDGGQRLETFFYPRTATSSIAAHPAWVPSGYPDVLPIHETAVCPQCQWAGVMIQGEQCRCAQCDYTWRWPLYAGMVGLD